MGVAEVKALAKAGISDDNIIGQICNTRTVYHLDPEAIIDLKNSGVSAKIISTMIATGNAVGNTPPTVPSSGVTATPAPANGYVWIGGEWAWNGAAWVRVCGRWGVPPYPRTV